MTTETTFEASEPKSGVFRISLFPVTRADIEAHMGLVHQVVARVVRRLPRAVLRDDLVAAGSHGLMDALRRTQGKRDERFTAYAKIRIRGAIIDELRKQDWLARAARADANARARAEGETASTIVAIDDLPESQHGDASCEVSPFEAVARLSDRKALARAVARLPEREARIVDLHYFQGVPFKEIATSLGVSEPRVSQLHSRALTMLRSLLEEESIDSAA
jgi:RNA polymerase sigma factor for flagellar operon FliA